MGNDAIPPVMLGADHLDAATREHIIAQVERELDAEVSTQNASLQGDNDMREISSLAQTMREAIASLKASAAAATQDFKSEVSNSNTNISKIKSLTKDLKDANKDVEQMLGESGSNFTPVGSESTLGKPDINGVQVNKNA